MTVPAGVKAALIKVVPYVIGVIVVTLAMTGVIGAIARTFYDNKLAKAEERVAQADSNAVQAQEIVVRTIIEGKLALKAAADHEAKAVAAAAKAPAPARKVKVDSTANAAIASAPADCAPALQSVEAARDLADSTALALGVAYREEKEAAAVLRGSLRATQDTLTNTAAALSRLQSASENLATTIKKGPSFLARLKPHFHIEPVQAGISPNGKAYVGAGVGLGWDL